MDKRAHSKFTAINPGKHSYGHVFLTQTEEQLWQLLDLLTSTGILRAFLGFIHTYLKQIPLHARMHWSNKPMVVKIPLFLELSRNWPKCSFNSQEILFSFALSLLSSNHTWTHYILGHLWINRWKNLMCFRSFYSHCLTSWPRPTYFWTKNNSRVGYEHQSCPV